MSDKLVYLVKEYDGLPEGSCIHVIDEDDYNYGGRWSSAVGTYVVSVPKEYCYEKPAPIIEEQDGLSLFIDFIRGCELAVKPKAFEYFDGLENIKCKIPKEGWVLY